MVIKRSYRAAKSERARRASERVERINADLDKGIKTTTKKSSATKPEGEPPKSPPKENPYDRMLRRLREDRSESNIV